MSRLVAPAKLTVSLAITGVRPDGFHELEAEMVTLDLADELVFGQPGQGLRVEAAPGSRAEGLAAGGTNLITRALAAVGREASVHVTKRIPLGAGLGGGSADAAAVLRWAGCADLDVAAELGADVPFCVVGGRARVEGIGERVTPLPFEEASFCLCLPPFGVETARVYAAWDEQPGHAHADTLSFELSIHGRRVIVNTGASTYEAGEQRAAERGTAAHNTVRVDGQNSSEVWSAFRVARRARVRNVRTDHYGYVEACHDGYRRLKDPVTHRRRLELHNDRLVITDTIQARREHTVEVFFHCHPGATVPIVLDQALARTECRTTWHPEFNRSIPNQTIIGTMHTPCPATFVSVVHFPNKRPDRIQEADTAASLAFDR